MVGKAEDQTWLRMQPQICRKRNAATKIFQGYFHLDSRRNSKGAKWPYLETFERIESMNFVAHKLSSTRGSESSQSLLEMRSRIWWFDFFDFFAVMVVFVHVRRKSMKYSGSEGVRHKESQSGSKFSGRRNESPNAFAVWKDCRWRKKESIWYADRCSR